VCSEGAMEGYTGAALVCSYVVLPTIHKLRGLSHRAGEVSEARRERAAEAAIGERQGEEGMLRRPSR